VSIKEFSFGTEPPELFEEFDFEAHSIDNSHCKGLRPSEEYRERVTGRRLKFGDAMGSMLGETEDGEYVELDYSPTWMSYVVSDEGSDIAHYLHRIAWANGAEVLSGKTVMKVEEPLRSVFWEWSGLGRLGEEYTHATPYAVWVDEELGPVMLGQQLWAYWVEWISPESLEIVRQRVRDLKEAGEWEEVHPNGATIVFKT
jgi:hypothetical protein